MTKVWRKNAALLCKLKLHINIREVVVLVIIIAAKSGGDSGGGHWSVVSGPSIASHDLYSLGYKSNFATHFHYKTRTLPLWTGICRLGLARPLHSAQLKHHSQSHLIWIFLRKYLWVQKFYALDFYFFLLFLFINVDWWLRREPFRFY